MHQHQYWTASRPVKTAGWTTATQHLTATQQDDRHSNKLWAQAWNCRASTPMHTLAQQTHKGTMYPRCGECLLLSLNSVSATPIPAAPIEGASPPTKPCVRQSLQGPSPLSRCKGSVQGDNSSCHHPLPTTHVAQPAPPRALLLHNLLPQEKPHRVKCLSSPRAKLHLIAQLPMPLLVHHRRRRSLVNS
jgi:hypothetical protein